MCFDEKWIHERKSVHFINTKYGNISDPVIKNNDVIRPPPGGFVIKNMIANHLTIRGKQVALSGMIFNDSMRFRQWINCRRCPYIVQVLYCLRRAGYDSSHKKCYNSGSILWATAQLVETTVRYIQYEPPTYEKPEDERSTCSWNFVILNVYFMSKL